VSPATRRLIDFAAAPHHLPGPVRADTERLLADTLAVGAAGSWHEEAGRLLEAARGWGAGGEARVLGRAERLPAPAAAAVNGFGIHCLEWDAVHEGAVVHALSVVTAALGAVIDRRGGCQPEAALTALAVGVEVACALGIAAREPPRFFRPATAGIVGASLAAARLAGLDGARFPDVLGLAVAQAAGTMQAHVEGSVALPLQIGLAARGAVVAVDLAAAGLSGPHDALEGPYGYFALMDPGDLGAVPLAAPWRVSEISVKPFPSGRASHGVLCAVLASQAEHRFAPEDVRMIEARVPPLVRRLVGRSMHPRLSPAEARLCLPFLLALALRDGAIDPRVFNQQTFADPDLAAVAGRLTLRVDEALGPNALGPQHVRVTLADGRVLEHAVPATLGSPAAPLDIAGMEAKRTLARELAPAGTDARLWTDPLAYWTDRA